MKHHKLKTWPEYFNACRDGIKLFEIRYNDRDFKVGDLITQEEFDPDTEEFSGNENYFKITYVCDFNQKEGYVVLGIWPFRNKKQFQGVIEMHEENLDKE